MTNIDERLERIRTRAEGMGLYFAECPVDEGSWMLGLQTEGFRPAEWGATFGYDYLHVAETLLAALDPEATRVDVVESTMTGIPYWYISEPPQPAPDGYEYVLLCRRKVT